MTKQITFFSNCFKYFFRWFIHWFELDCMWSPIIQLSFYHCLPFPLWYLIHCSGTSYLKCTLVNSLNRGLYKIIVRIVKSRFTKNPFTWFKMWKNLSDYNMLKVLNVHIWKKMWMLHRIFFLRFKSSELDVSNLAKVKFQEQ